MQCRSSLRWRERQIDHLSDYEYRFHVIQFLHVIEADAESAAIVPEGNVRLLCERYQRPREKRELEVSFNCLFLSNLILFEAEFSV